MLVRKIDEAPESIVADSASACAGLALNAVSARGRYKPLGVLVDSETSAPGSSGLARASQASCDRGTR